jgi:hypothetical protein
VVLLLQITIDDIRLAAPIVSILQGEHLFNFHPYETELSGSNLPFLKPAEEVLGSERSEMRNSSTYYQYGSRYSPMLTSTPEPGEECAQDKYIKDEEIDAPISPVPFFALLSA